MRRVLVLSVFAFTLLTGCVHATYRPGTYGLKISDDPSWAPTHSGRALGATAVVEAFEGSHLAKIDVGNNADITVDARSMGTALQTRLVNALKHASLFDGAAGGPLSGAESWLLVRGRIGDVTLTNNFGQAKSGTATATVLLYQMPGQVEVERFDVFTRSRRPAQGDYEEGFARVVEALVLGLAGELVSKMASSEQLAAHVQIHPELELAENRAPSPRVDPLPPTSTTASASVDYGGYRALVIGNNRYQHLPELVTARSDASAVAQVLRDEYGFRVALLLDATRDQIISQLARLRRSSRARDNVLIYYAGHGWYDEEALQGYWLPVDASEDDPSNWVSNSTLTDLVRANPAKHVMVIADSCFSGTLTRGISIRSRSDGYFDKLARKKARTALTSGGLEPVEDGNGSGHSAFALALLDALRENQAVLDGHALYTAIRRPVMLNADQTPDYGDIRRAGHNGGDFLFVRENRANVR